MLTTDSVKKLTKMTTITIFLIVYDHSNNEKRTENALKLLKCYYNSHLYYFLN